MKTEREQILARIREALQGGATVHPVHPGAAVGGSTHGSAQGVAGAGHARQWLPAAAGTLEAQLAQLRANSEDLKTELRLVADDAELEVEARSLAGQAGWKRVGSHRGELTERVCASIGLPVLWTDDGYDVEALEGVDAGITGCDAIVAQTGSVLVTSRSAGGRALSVLPPHHVVVARRTQIVADLPAAFELLRERYGDRPPSFISFITGPSRTGDIERILVLGAHGPKRLTLLCV